MAENKKSFIAYSDWNGTFKAVPDEIAGQLIKYIFSYVNDENPEPHENYVVNALFEQIKATLKRDLDKWDKQREQRSRAGKKSAEQRATKSNDRSTVVNEKARNPTVSVSVSDSVSVTVNDTVKKDDDEDTNNANFKHKLIDIDLLYKNYLQNKRVLNAVLKNKKNKFTSVGQIKTKLTEFVALQKESSVFKKTEADFASHFRYWHLKKADGSDTVQKRTNTIPIG